jgi:hypothetical protein
MVRVMNSRSTKVAQVFQCIRENYPASIDYTSWGVREAKRHQIGVQDLPQG